jgi:hypothetical protein
MEIFGARIEESSVGQDLRATLSDPTVDGVQKLTVASVEGMIRKVFAEEFDPKNKKFWKPKLTWTQAEASKMAPTDKVVGEWNPRLPSIWSTNKTWVVQNCNLLNSAGKRIKLEDLSDSKKTWVDKTGTPHVAPSDRQDAAAAMEVYRKIALEDDPLFCEMCVEGNFRAKDWDDRTKHIYKFHPVEFAQMVDSPIATSMEVVSAIPDKEETEVNQAGELVCCGKTYSSIGRVNQHRSVSKAHKG